MTITQPIKTSSTKSLRSFFTIWIGQVFSLLGSELVQFALVWWLTKTTGSATVLAMAAMMAVLEECLWAGQPRAQ